MAIELDNTFTVPVSPEKAWDVLLDVERIAPCMPGASVLSISDDSNEIEGQVKVKLGPLSLSYKGTAKFVDKDQAAHAITIDASGKETRGAGTASASVHASLKPDEAGTLVTIHTSLNVTGRPAQFGRSLLPEVSGKLIAQFAANLEALIAAGDAPSAQDTATEDTAAVDTAAVDTAAADTVTGADASPAADAAAEPDATAGATSVGAGPAAGHSTPTAPAFEQEESLNAFKFIVVPVLKKALPVVAVGVAGVAITLAVRRFTGKKK
jgi:carbon monoxide dehydrogenase subunit G